MRLIDRYLLRQLLGPVVLATAALTAVALLSQSLAGGTPTGQPPQADYAALGTPSVWRSARSKVETLASSGMDEIEIPAFLRKQAD